MPNACGRLSRSILSIVPKGILSHGNISGSLTLLLEVVNELDDSIEDDDENKLLEEDFNAAILYEEEEEEEGDDASDDEGMKHNL
jgi:hypothetical protein